MENKFSGGVQNLTRIMVGFLEDKEKKNPNRKLLNKNKFISGIFVGSKKPFDFFNFTTNSFLLQ